MKQSIYAKKKKDELEKKAIKLYKEGLPLREVGSAITPKRSHEWVRKTLIKHGLSTA
jgi:hypothetical protein